MLRLQPSPDERTAFSNDSGSTTCTANTVYYIDDNGKNIIWCNYGEEYFSVTVWSTGQIFFKVNA